MNECKKICLASFEIEALKGPNKSDKLTIECVGVKCKLFNVRRIYIGAKTFCFMIVGCITWRLVFLFYPWLKEFSQLELFGYIFPLYQGNYYFIHIYRREL